MKVNVTVQALWYNICLHGYIVYGEPSLYGYTAVPNAFSTRCVHTLTTHHTPYISTLCIIMPVFLQLSS